MPTTEFLFQPLQIVVGEGHLSSGWKYLSKNHEAREINRLVAIMTKIPIIS